MSLAADPTLRGLLIQPLAVERKEVRDDAAGGQVVRWVTVGHVLGRVSTPPSSRPSEVRVALSAAESMPYYVYLPIDADVQRGDVLNDGRRRLRVDSVMWPSVEVYHRAEVYEFQEEIPSFAPEEQP